MSDTPVSSPKRVRAPLPVIDSVVEPEEAPAPKTRKYVVREGCGIHMGYRNHFAEGSIVELTAKMAKHFVKKKAVDPFIEDDDDE